MASPSEDTENKGSMWDLDQKLDQPMDEEGGRLRNVYRQKKFSGLLLLRLAFQSLGVVYGDLGTSPLANDNGQVSLIGVLASSGFWRNPWRLGSNNLKFFLSKEKS